MSHDWTDINKNPRKNPLSWYVFTVLLGCWVSYGAPRAIESVSAALHLILRFGLELGSLWGARIHHGSPPWPGFGAQVLRVASQCSTTKDYTKIGHNLQFVSECKRSIGAHAMGLVGRGLELNSTRTLTLTLQLNSVLFHCSYGYESQALCIWKRTRFYL